MQRPLGLTEDNALVILMAAHKLNYTPLEINIKSLPPKTLKNKLQKNVLTHNENKELKKVMKSKLKKKGRKSNHSKKKDYELKNTTENFKEKVYLESMEKLHCHVCYPLLV